MAPELLAATRCRAVTRMPTSPAGDYFGFGQGAPQAKPLVRNPPITTQIWPAAVQGEHELCPLVASTLQ